MRFYDYIAVLRFPNGHEVEQEIRAKMCSDAFDMAMALCDMMDTELICLNREEDQYKEDLQLEALYEERYDLGD